MNESSSGAGPGSSPFPLPPAAFDGASRKVEAGACFDWLRQGWALFTGNPGIWIACALLTLVVLIVLPMVPIVGSLATLLFSPVLGAGLFHLCRRQSEGATPAIADLFIGFKERTSDLILVGVAFAVAMLAIGALVGLVVGGGMLGGAAAGMMGGGHMVGFGLMLGGILVGLLLVTVLSVPVSMAVWFAPALVFFNGMQPLPAMKASFHACLKNWLAFGVYGVILFILFSLAAPTLVGLLVLIPVLAGAQYASYRDIFVGV